MQDPLKRSQAARRELALPDQLVTFLRAHLRAQKEARLAAGPAWQESGLLFTQPHGGAVDPDAYGREWKRLLKAAKVRAARLHDARHTAATLLLLQGVPERIVMEICGWTSQAMLKMYTHVVDEMKRAAAEAMSSALWGPTATTTATSDGSGR